MTLKWQDAAVLLAAAFLLGWLLSHATESTAQNTIQEKEIVREHFDTAHSVVYVPFRPLGITGTSNHAKTLTLHDTIYREACLDTLIASDTTALAPDTLSVCYARDTFSVAVGFSPRRKRVEVPYVAHDTFYWHEHFIPTLEENKRSWYDDALLVILSLAGGIIIGKL
jgi:hypothetical protein